MSTENFIVIDFLAVKLDGSDVNQGVCKEVFIWTDTLVDVTSVNFNSKNVYEDEIFGRIFLRRIQRLQICKISTDVRGTLNILLLCISISPPSLVCVYEYFLPNDANLVPSSLPTRWRHGVEVSGEIEF